MPVITVVALAVAVAVAIVAAVMWAIARGSQEPQLAPRALERSTGSVDAERAGPEPRSEPPLPVEPAPAEARRSIIPPAVAEALASGPETASEPGPAPAAPAPPPAPEPDAAPVVAVVAVVAPADRASIEADDPERKKARKLARLFVSEIKLYNEKLVAEGRAAGDLYARLKDPIDQSLVAFERRVSEAVRVEFDYMHDELVRQLAEGDASKLGAHYRRLLRGS
jgi:hypothetical protein